MKFPLYRKLSTLDVYYKINSPENFTEFKKMGNTFFESVFIATIYPDKLRIQDMIHCTDPFEEINESNFLKVITDWDEKLNKISF